MSERQQSYEHSLVVLSFQTLITPGHDVIHLFHVLGTIHPVSKESESRVMV